MEHYKSLLLVIIGLCVTTSSYAQQQQIIRVGNSDKASVSGVDVPGAIFLLNDQVLLDGVVFAFSAFFRADSAVRFQIWRPVVNSTSTQEEYFLVGETRHVPSVIFSREDVYIESKITEKCIRVKTTDRIGVYFEQSPTAIAYVFNSNNPTALGATLANVSIPTPIGSSIGFNSFTFPYDFSVAAYIHTNLSAYNGSSDQLLAECPKGMLIPNFDTVTISTTPTTPITGRPGATGPTGAQGPAGSAGATGPTGPIGANGTMGQPGNPGSTGATGPMGPNGTMGATGPSGAIGATGALGPKGDQGNVGPQGPPGPPGPTRPVVTGDPSAVPVQNEDSVFSNPWLVLALLIWLAVVTICIIILVITLCCCYCCKPDEEEDEKQQKAYEKKYNYNEDLEASIAPSANGKAGNENHRTSTASYLDIQPSWVNTMKSTSESIISVNTIEEDNGSTVAGSSPQGGDLTDLKQQGTGSDNLGSHSLNGSVDSLITDQKPVGEGRTEF